jgi:histidinol-phosphate aminotransferase
MPPVSGTPRRPESVTPQPSEAAQRARERSLDGEELGRGLLVAGSLRLGGEVAHAARELVDGALDRRKLGTEGRIACHGVIMAHARPPGTIADPMPSFLLRRVDLRGMDAGELERTVAAAGRVVAPSEAVAAIIDEVRRDGDEALLRLTERFDGLRPKALVVGRERRELALRRTPLELRRALDEAARRLAALHATELPSERTVELDGVRVERRAVPVRRAGLYAPGGRARYPSSVLMVGVPAKVAGVRELVLCVPPGPSGEPDDLVLAASVLAGVDEVYCVGGAQAIAALAYGTETIRPVEVIAGPGNAWVAEAKRQVAGVVGVPAAFTGPSEVAVVAAAGDAVAVALDLAAQAEHGPDGRAWLLTWSEAFADAVDAALSSVVARSTRRAALEATLGSGGFIGLVEDAHQALCAVHAIAPEHLELIGDEAEALAGEVRAAGAVFVGALTPASLADYVLGVNHVLPTGRTARFGSPLAVEDFLVRPHVVEASAEAVRALGPLALELARAEGLGHHAEAIEHRLLGLRGPVAAHAPRRRRTATAPNAPSGERTGTPAYDGAARLAVRPQLARLEPYRSPQPAVAVRLNANESAWPPPAEWLEELAAELRRIPFERYPDRSARELRSAIGSLHGVGPEWVFAANGSNEVLQCLMLAFGGPGRRALVFEPTYGLHRHIAALVGTEVVAWNRREDFSVDEALVAEALARVAPDVACFCSPNNPTGLTEPRPVLEAALELAPGLVVVDEAYGQFARTSAIDCFGGAMRREAQQALVVVRTFSKTWAMAGVRLGYLVAAPAIVEACERAALPYHLGAFAQAAGRLAVRHVDAMRARVEQIVAERERLVAALRQLEVDVWPSEANFVMFRPRRLPGAAVHAALLERSVLVRDLSAWPGAKGCLRVTIGRPEENDRFLDALASVLARAGDCGDRAGHSRSAGSEPERDLARVDRPPARSALRGEHGASPEDIQ